MTAARAAVASSPAKPGGEAFEGAIAAFARLDLTSRPRVVVAVSGGSDSLALLLLFKRYLDESGARTRVVAVTVDHGLRTASAAEARQVAAIAARLGIDHRTLVWRAPKPASGIQAAAREARHRLLAQAAIEAGTDLVLTGHTLNDQAETAAMRGARGGGRGEAGIAPATLHRGKVWFARPLLGIRRAALRDFLVDGGETWIDDASNADARYERVRARAALSDADALRLVADAAQAAARRVDLGRRAAALIGAHAGQPAPGLLRLAPALLKESDREAALYALRILLAAVGGREHLPDEARAARLLDRLSALNFRATLSRAVIDVRKAGIFLHRERRGLPARTPFTPGIWDSRFMLEGQSGGDVGPALAQGAAAVDEKAAKAGGFPASLARAAAQAHPALAVDGRMEPLPPRLPPNSDGAAARPLVAPWSRYLPSFDIAPALAAARLFGADEIPPPPSAGHNAGAA